MTGSSSKKFWAVMGPRYLRLFPDMCVGLGFIALVYYKVYHGDKKAVKDKPAPTEFSTILSPPRPAVK